MSHNELRATMAICADLLFAARIRGAAAQAGREVEVVTRAGDVVSRIRTVRPTLLLLDLDARWVDAPALIRELKQDAELASIPVIAFVSHVREDAIAAARSAGADRVLARSAFVKQLPLLFEGMDG